MQYDNDIRRKQKIIIKSLILISLWLMKLLPKKIMLNYINYLFNQIHVRHVTRSTGFLNKITRFIKIQDKGQNFIMKVR